jgi:hypothetical protein
MPDRGPANMNAPGYALHPLKGNLEGHWAVRVSGNWRLKFAFEGEDANLVDYFLPNTSFSNEVVCAAGSLRISLPFNMRVLYASTSQTSTVASYVKTQDSQEGTARGRCALAASNCKGPLQRALSSCPLRGASMDYAPG